MEVCAKMSSDPTEHRLPDAISARPESDFTAVRNSALRDSAMSWKAKGLLATLLSNSRGWYSFEATLLEMSTDGRDALRSGIAELEEHKYLLRIEYRDVKSKRFKGSFWAYTDEPGQFDIRDQLGVLAERGLELQSPWTGFPATEKPRTENPTLSNTNTKKTNSTNTTSNSGSSETQILFDTWNRLCSESQLSPLRKLTPKRRTAAAARVRDYGLKDCKQAIRRVHRSKFCRGDSDRGWKADIDWLLRPDTIARVLEGKYDDRDSANGRFGRSAIIAKNGAHAVAANGEPINLHKWYTLADEDGDGKPLFGGKKKLWESMDGRIALGPVGEYPEPYHDGELAKGVRLVDRDEVRELLGYTP